MIPTRVIGGRYVVLSELGRGGMGVVWRAEDRVIGRQVAVKELRLPPGLPAAEHARFRERLLREARTAGRLNHPGIVTVHDVICDEGVDHIVMELIEARTLADIVAADGPLDETSVTEVARQVLAALRCAHEDGVVHRDVKPSNIMLAADGRVTLTDFGIAQAVDDPRITSTGLLVGSPGYLAPERLSGGPVAPPADLWALGATLYHALEGVGPFQRDSTAATIYAVMNSDPPAPRCRGPLGPVIAGLLIRSPQSRLTAEQSEVLLAARPAAPTGAGEPATEPLAARSRRPRRTLVAVAVAGLLGLVLGTVGGVTLLRGDDASPVRVLSYGPDGDLPQFAISYPTCLNAQLVAGRVISSDASVSCGAPHDQELFEVFSPFDGGAAVAYPVADDLSRYAAAACSLVFNSARVGGPDKQRLAVSALVPTQASFNAGDGSGSRAVYCLLGNADGSQLTGTRITDGS
jgi:predicted Ser/Thr protein kinase